MSLYLAHPGGSIDQPAIEQLSASFLLGEHIIGVTWDDVTTWVFDMGTMASPRLGDSFDPVDPVDPADPAHLYHEFTNTSLQGITRGASTTGSGRPTVGLWTFSELVTIEFENLEADPLVVHAAVSTPYPGGENFPGFQYPIDTDGDWEYLFLGGEGGGTTQWRLKTFIGFPGLPEDVVAEYEPFDALAVRSGLILTPAHRE